MQLHIRDGSGSPIIGANVTSTVKPAGTQTLSAVTNETGYVLFQNVTLGNYTFCIVKHGYYQMFEPIKMKGQPLNLTISLSSAASNVKGGGSFPTVLVIGVVVAVVVVIAVLLIVKRRRASAPDVPTSTY